MHPEHIHIATLGCSLSQGICVHSGNDRYLLIGKLANVSLDHRCDERTHGRLNKEAQLIIYRIGRRIDAQHGHHLAYGARRWYFDIREYSLRYIKPPFAQYLYQLRLVVHGCRFLMVVRKEGNTVSPSVKAMRYIVVGLQQQSGL